MPFAVYLRLLWRACAQGVRAGWLGGASVLLSVVFYFQNAFSVCEVARALRASMRTVTRRLRGVRAFAAVASKLQDAVWAPCSVWFPGAPAPAPAGEQGDLPSRRQSLRDFYAMDPAALDALLRRMCMADAVLSVLRARRALGMTLPAWTPAGTEAQLALHGFWHPAVPADRAVRNTLVLREGGARSVVLTGANACGKSTLLKAVLTNALLAHTLGVCCAERATMTPLALIASSIHVSDRYDKESLFEAELARCSALLGGRPPPTGLPPLPRLVVVDELFSCTNPVEGVAAAYAVTEALAEAPSTLSIVSTHFTYLATLPRRVPGCVNMCMKASVRDGGITYDYRLRPGVSRQYLALEIAAGRRGLDPAVLRRAIETKKKFSVPHVRP
jgi:DNA mismatch repair ATPase MutS